MISDTLLNFINKKLMKKILIFSLVLLTLISCSGPVGPRKWSLNEVESTIKEEGKLVVTEVDVEKVLFWDSDAQKYAWDDMEKYKNFFGTQKYILVVGATLQYGYDANKISFAESGDSISIQLPQPEYLGCIPEDTIKTDKVVEIKTGLRDYAGSTRIINSKQQCIAMIDQKGDSILNIVKPDVQFDIKIALQSLLPDTGRKLIVKY